MVSAFKIQIGWTFYIRQMVLATCNLSQILALDTRARQRRMQARASLRYMAHWRGALHGERGRWIWMSGWKGAERGTDTRRQRILLGKLLRWHTLLYPLTLPAAIHPAPPLPIPYSTLMSEPCSLLRLHICAAHTHTREDFLVGGLSRPFLPSLVLCSFSAATRRNCAGTASIIREGPKWAAGRRLRSRRQSRRLFVDHRDGNHGSNPSFRFRDSSLIP